MIKRHEDYDAYLKQMGRYMRMAIKYEVAAVQEDIADAMKCDWPDQLYLWDEVSQAKKDVEPASLLVFGSSYNLPNVRALALYLLSQLDGGMCYVKYACVGENGARWHLLTSNDFHDLLRVIELQRSAWLVTRRPCTDCGNTDNETTKRQQVKREVLEKRDCLATLHRYITDTQNSKYCSKCWSVRINDAERAKKDFWSELQQIGKGQGHLVCY